MRSLTFRLTLFFSLGPALYAFTNLLANFVLCLGPALYAFTNLSSNFVLRLGPALYAFSGTPFGPETPDDEAVGYRHDDDREEEEDDGDGGVVNQA